MASLSQTPFQATVWHAGIRQLERYSFMGFVGSASTPV
jgi:hypothetical protein